MKKNDRFNILLSMLLLSFAISIMLAYLNNENRVTHVIIDDEIPLSGVLYLDNTSLESIECVKLLENEFKEYFLMQQ